MKCFTLNGDPFTRWSFSGESEVLYGIRVICLSQEQLGYSTKYIIHWNWDIKTFQLIMWACQYTATFKEILIYCNVCCLIVINAQSLHHKNDWTSKNLDYIHFSFSCFYMVIQGVHSLLYCQNPYSHMKCLLPKSNQYCNTLKHNTQYNIDLYCFTPSTYTAGKL